MNRSGFVASANPQEVRLRTRFACRTTCQEITRRLPLAAVLAHALGAPLHKRKSRAAAGNYRGVHLTSQLSKVIERIICAVVVPWAESIMMQGPNQYAYSRGRNYHDTLLVNVCIWISAMDLGWMVGVYCSDVAGTFDRVDRQRLCNKLRVSGLHPKVIAFLMSWSEDRVSRVVLGGAHSLDEISSNSVCQGTVPGPAL